MSDPFDEIHKLEKSGKNSLALTRLLNDETGRIKKPYSVDLNHAWYTAGDILYKMKKYAEAIRAFKKALLYWREDIEALWAIANCYSELGKPWLAKHYLLKAVSLDGERDEIRYNLGNAFFDMRKYREAIEQYQTIKQSNNQLFRTAHLNIERAEKEIRKK